MSEIYLNSENHEIDISPGKIFEALKIPERFKQVCRLQSNVRKLSYSVSLLDMFITKPKSTKKNQKTKRLFPLIHPKNLVKQMSAKKIVRIDSPVKKQIHKYKSIDNINETPYNKNNKKIFKTCNSKKTKDFRSENKLKKNINSSIFVTNVKLPDIDENKKDKYNSNSKIYKFLFNDNNNSDSNLMKSNKSPKKILPILTDNNINNNKNNFNYANKRYYNHPQSANKYSLFNNNQNMNNLIQQINNNINNYNKNSNSSIKITPINTEIPKNSNVIKNINIKPINNNYNSIETSSFRKMNFLKYRGRNKSKIKLPKLDKIENLSKKYRKLNKNLKQSCFEYDLDNWEMKSKFKYAQWKYGIADIQKYFVDLKEFGQKEETELEFRKSFYEKVDDIIKEIQKTQEKRELISNDNGKLYKGSIVLDEKENEYDKYELLEKKRMKLVKVMKKNEERRNKEKIKRNMIDEILYQCKRGANIINRSQTET